MAPPGVPIVKHWILLSLLVAPALIAGLGCDEKGTCDKHCAMFPYVRAEHAEATDGVLEHDVEECVDMCLDACPDCYSELSREQRKAMKKCVGCVYSKVGAKPSSDEYYSAMDECEERCDGNYWNDYVRCQDINGGTCLIVYDMPPW
jgi:hypothetical protein